MAKSMGKRLPVFLSLLCCAQLTLTSTSIPVRADSDSNKEKVTVLLKGGIEEHQKGDDAGAEKKFKEALKLDSSNANAHYNLAALAEAHGEVGTALKEYRQVLKYSPNDQTVLTAIHDLEAAKGSHSAVAERTMLNGHATQDSLLPSADAFTSNVASLSEYPPLAPARGTLNANANRNGLVSSAQFNNVRNPQSTNLALANNHNNFDRDLNQNNNTGGSMHAFRTFGMQFLRAGLMYGGRGVDTCACPILRF